LSDQITRREKAERGRRLAEIEQELRESYFASLVGRRLQVLLESSLEQDPSRLVGTSCRYAPVELSAGSGQFGQLVDCTATRLAEQRLIASGC
jgi:threonylcarbamoyladenosine tRNA methylthiotransferase MtaB